jgi:hypothetical protein
LMKFVFIPIFTVKPENVDSKTASINSIILPFRRKFRVRIFNQAPSNFCFKE